MKPHPFKEPDVKPYGVDDIEADLRAAIDADDEAEIGRLGALLDHAPAPAPVSLHAAALWYVSVGLRVFPLQPGAKVPFKGSSGCKDATSDPEQVTRWWEGNPDANIGVATGHLVDVIDIDGPDGVRSYLELVDHLPPVFGKVSTPRPGGTHLYIAAVEGRGNRAALAPGVDYRSHHGYVVGPPSVNTDRVTYYWRTPLDIDALKQSVAA